VSGMPSHLTNPWNFAVAYLEMTYQNQFLASGSGFFWKVNERTLLVTNWHNFSGRNSENGVAMSDTGGLPSHVVFTAYKRLSEPDTGGFFEMSIERIRVPLYHDGDLSGARWLVHPRFAQRVDVAAIDVSEVLEGLIINHVNVIEADAVLQPYPSQDVFIIGYPLGLVTGVPTPVWKRGTIATDPAFDPDGLPKMFVDSATRKGMSGSVVLARHIIVGRAVTKKDGTATQPYLYAVNDVVAGIYSSRLGADHVQAQLGIVWKRHTIEETVVGNSIANVE